MTQEEKKSLEQMARNLIVCSKKTVDDVLLHLPDNKKSFLLEMITKLKK